MSSTARNYTFEKNSTPKPFIHENQTLIIGIGIDLEGSRLYICPLCPKTAKTRSSFCRHGRDHKFPIGAALFKSLVDMDPNPAASAACKLFFFHMSSHAYLPSCLQLSERP